MFKSILAASVIALAASTSAFAASPAAPASAAAAITADRAPLVEVQHRRSSSEHARHRPRYQGRYHPGRRYSRAPRGWHRYSARPWNWQRRGCILVGPVWFCP